MNTNIIYITYLLTYPWASSTVGVEAIVFLYTFISFALILVFIQLSPALLKLLAICLSALFCLALFLTLVTFWLLSPFLLSHFPYWSSFPLLGLVHYMRPYLSYLVSLSRDSSYFSYLVLQAISFW